MENPIRTPGIETVNPDFTGGQSRLPSIRQRRSRHLESASYRTLVRIFSLCLELDESSDLPLPEQPRDPNPNLEAPESSSVGKDWTLDRPGCGIVANDEPAHGGKKRTEVSTCLYGEDSILKRSDGGVPSTEEVGHGDKERPEDPNGVNVEHWILDQEDTGIVSADGFWQHGGKESSKDHDCANGDVLNRPVCERPQSGNGKGCASLGTDGLGQEDKERPLSSDVGFGKGVVLAELKAGGASLHESVSPAVASQSPGEAMFDHHRSSHAQDNLISLVEGLQGEVASSEKNALPELATLKNQIGLEREKIMELGQISSGVLAAESDAMLLCESQISSFAELLDELREDHEEDNSRGLEKEISTDKLLGIIAKDQEPVLTNESCEKLDTNLEIPVIHLDKNKEIEEGYTPSKSSEKFDANPESPVVHSDSNEEIEEGQIPGDFLSSDQSLELVHESTQLEDQKLKKLDICNINIANNHIASRDSNFNMNIANNHNASRYSDFTEPESIMFTHNEKVKSTTIGDAKCQGVSQDIFGLPKQNFSSQNKPSSFEAPEVGVKRKRGPLTEERKAKKKKAKKLKRAQKEREQGVKRLKLQMIVKPKTVQYCSFYLKGRCQQGDLCKFSHDTTPLTKSTPCKYFACDSCLKGDDCPFDHQLSKYPCHNFLTNGTCTRGDRCKFSHKISEGSSPTAVISNIVSPLTSEKLESRKQNGNLVSPLTSEKLESRNQNGMRSSFAVASDVSKFAPQNSKPSMHQMLGSKPSKEPLRIPKGVRFLSLGGESSNDLHKDKSLLEKYGGTNDCNQENQDKFLMDGHLSSSKWSEKPLHKVRTVHGKMSGGTASGSVASAFAIKDLKNKGLANGPDLVAGSRNLHSEASDASKILEEFLFVDTG